MIRKEILEDKTLDLPNGGSVSKRKMRRSIQRYFGKIISVLVADLDCTNPSVRVASAKVLLAKILPDLKATELTGKDGSKIDGLLKIVYENSSPESLANNSR